MELLTLTADPEFRALIPKLRPSKYLQLESAILEKGCQDDILTWNGIIIEGYDHYEICHRYRIPFRIHEMEFDCREAVMAWICANQLRHRSISNETRKYLIGTQYRLELITNSKRIARGLRQYTTADYFCAEIAASPRPARCIADKLANEHHIAPSTVTKYASFSKALEKIGKQEPTLGNMILSGRCRVSHKTILKWATLPSEALHQINCEIKHTPTALIHMKDTRNALHSYMEATAADSTPSITGVSDPDTDVNDFCVAASALIGTIEHIRKNIDLSGVSPDVHKKLTCTLRCLLDSVGSLLLDTENI